MKILFIAGSPYGDSEGHVLNINIMLDEGEKIAVGDMISIELMDDSVIFREVRLIDPKYAGDYAPVSKAAADGVIAGEYGMSPEPETSKTGKCTCSVVVLDVPYHEVKTENNINRRKFREKLQRMRCITPYRQLKLGTKNIHDYVDAARTVPEKVIAYLKKGKPYLMSPRVYDHPFKPGKSLLGPYSYTDGYFYWDSDTWIYVLKYGLILPDEFVEHVMGDEGNGSLRKDGASSARWGDIIKKWEKESIVFLADNGGDHDIDDF